jgi:hypothetical protein
VVRDVPRCVHPAGFLEVPFMRPLLQGPYFRPSETRRQVEYLCSLRRGYQWDVWLNRNAANNAFTLGIRTPVQTYSQCLAANSGNYSVYNRLPSSWQNGATKFALGNDVSNALFGDANEGTAGLLVGAGAGAAPLGVGTAGTYGRRTASIFDLNLSGTTGPAPTILGKTGAAEAVGWAAYLLTIEPVAGAPFFLQAPKPLQILDGQRAEIDLATSRDGYVKAVASIQITKYERRLSSIPANRAEPHDLTLDALHLMVSDAQIFKNDTRIAEHAGGATGNSLVAYLPGTGRVFFSLLPQKDLDFTQNAVVENNRIIFEIGADHYEIASQGSVIGQPGPWKIYMLRALDTTPCNTEVDASQAFVWAEGPLTSESLKCEAP